MGTKKITITLDERQVALIKDLVDSGKASSMSGFVQHAVGIALDDIAGGGALLAEALERSGGPLTDEERIWADEVLSPARPPGQAAEDHRCAP